MVRKLYVGMYMFNPPPQFSRLGIQVSLAIYVCLSGLWLGGLLPLSTFLKDGVLCISMHTHGQWRREFVEEVMRCWGTQDWGCPRVYCH